MQGSFLNVDEAYEPNAASQHAEDQTHKKLSAAGSSQRLPVWKSRDTVHVLCRTFEDAHMLQCHYVGLVVEWKIHSNVCCAS